MMGNQTSPLILSMIIDSDLVCPVLILHLRRFYLSAEGSSSLDMEICLRESEMQEGGYTPESPTIHYLCSPHKWRSGKSAGECGNPFRTRAAGWNVRLLRVITYDYNNCLFMATEEY